MEHARRPPLKRYQYSQRHKAGTRLRPITYVRRPAAEAEVIDVCEQVVKLNDALAAAEHDRGRDRWAETGEVFWPWLPKGIPIP